MKKAILGTGLLLLAASAGAQSVDVGTGDWSAFPQIAPRGTHLMSEVHMDRIDQLAAAGTCNVPGLERARVDISVPFVIRYGNDGSVDRVIVRDLSCPQLEVILGDAIVRLARTGEYPPAANSRDGWYRSEIHYANN